MLDRKPSSYIIAIVSFGLYFLIGYHIQRHETALLLGVYTVSFVLFSWVILKENQHIDFWIYVAIVFRCVLLFSTPSLSEDVYRFIWDGRLLAAGQHPFAHVPSYYIDNGILIPGIDEALYSKLNSKNYFTVYPPVAQYLFWASAKISSSIYGSLLFLKASILAADIGCIFLLKSLIRRFNFNQKNVLLYALNPLVIIELTGNAHFEPILLFFLLLSFYFIVQKKLLLAALPFAVSICIKLIPLIFLPAFIAFFGIKKAFQFCVVTAMMCVILFIPLLDMEIIYGFQHSLGYYFSRFEFNASLYYLIRALGYLLWGHNIVYIAGGLLATFATVIILMFSLRWSPKLTTFLYSPDSLDANNINPKLVAFHLSITFSLFTYFIFTTTVHPWYLTTLLALTVFTSYRFVIVWTFTIFFTYASYSEKAFHENLWIVAFEYLTLFGYLGYEILARRQSVTQQHKVI